MGYRLTLTAKGVKELGFSPYILLSLTAFFWSLNFIIGKMVSGVIPPITLSFLRWFSPLVFFLALNWKEIHKNRVSFTGEWPTILFLGATGYSLNSIFVYEAVKFTSVINTSFINAFQPVLIAFTAYLWNGEKVTRAQGIGFVVSFIGVLYIIFQGQWALIAQLKINPGDLFMFGSIAIWSIHTILYKNTAAGFPETPMFTLMILAGLVLTMPAALVEGSAYHWSWTGRITVIDILGILALNVFPSVLAYRFWNDALKKISPNKVGIFLYLIPVYTTVISVLFLGERLRPYHLIGGVLILTGLVLVTNVVAFPGGARRESP